MVKIQFCNCHKCYNGEGRKFYFDEWDKNTEGGEKKNFYKIKMVLWTISDQRTILISR
jgi:hypothetical protein